MIRIMIALTTCIPWASAISAMWTPRSTGYSSVIPICARAGGIWTALGCGRISSPGRKGARRIGSLMICSVQRMFSTRQDRRLWSGSNRCLQSGRICIWGGSESCLYPRWMPCTCGVKTRKKTLLFTRSQ